MTRPSHTLALLLPALLAVAGCKPSIVGKWNGNVTVGPASLPATVTFADGGKVDASATVSSPLRGTLATSGTYRIDGEQIEINLASPTFNGKSSPLIEQLLGGKAPLSGKYGFKIDGDTLTLDKTVLTRVKP